MVKKASILAAIVLVSITAYLFYGAMLASGEETEGPEGSEGDGIRLPFVTGVLAFLAFVGGYALRDVLGRRAQRAARPPAAGRKPA